MTTAPLPAAVVARAAPFPVPGAAAAAVSGALLLALTSALVAAAGPAPASADVVRVAGEHPVLTEVVTSLLLAVGFAGVLLAHRPSGRQATAVASSSTS